ncbi:MAG: tetratricopeptide repeat protein [Reichenbachiella sp.]|uniref:O-linked N-acetylglucosamine transferase family protein n=1 Tax=Reichenbachiella sp. TaxID=2184521 RepID=UPI002966A372|nr:tetratricopeptide repeat protein [Reichenbachiella sp.]MDW3208404.1 tetratricopeptide repeat protein [Reichenbachiella sp.]
MITAKAYYDQLLQEATLAHQSGDLIKAITLYKQLTKDMSGQPEPYHRLALIHAQKGEYKEAIPWFEKAVAIMPDHPAYNTNFAETLQRVDQNDRAIELLRKTISRDPNILEANQKLATILKKTGSYVEAADLFKGIIEKEPKFYPAFFQLGTLMLETGNFKSAKEYLESAVELNPKAIKALNNLAVAHQEWDEYEEAILCYEKALKSDPNYTDSVRNLALIHEKIGQPEKAKAYWTRLAKLKNDDPLISWKAEIVEPAIFRSTQEIDQFRKHVEDQLSLIKKKKINIDADQLTQLDVYPPAGLIYHGRSDFEVKKKYGELFKGIPKVQLQKKSSGKPQVGFVVTGGHEGVFLKCMKGLINRLSTEKMDITIVCSFPNGVKIVKPAIENPAIKLLSLPKSLGQGIHLLSSLNFDLLYYWEVGTDAYNYFIPYFKPARVQVTSWGWPTTSGIPTMDYFISARGLDEESDQKSYSEQLVLFKKLPAYYFSPEVPELNLTRTHFGIKEDANLYLCAQNVKKVHPDFDQLVKEILEKDEKGIVAFLGDKHALASEALERRLKKSCGNHADRVMVLPRQDKAGYFNILNLADVVLDTIYYNGGANTNGDAFALDKPVVTLPVDFHRGRYTATAYAQMGFDDLVGKNMEDYVTLAVRTATDSGFLEMVSQKIAENKHLFFEDEEAVLELEKFIEEVTQAGQAGKPLQEASDDNSAQEWLKKGLFHKQKHQLKPAFDALNKARQLDPTNVEILKRFAELLSDLGQNRDAFIAYKKAIGLAPNDPEILNNFGGLLLENRQFEEAIPLLKRSAETDPNQQSAFVNLGLAYEHAGDTPAAEKIYERIIERLEEDDLFRLHIETLCPNIAQSNEEIDNYRSRTKAILLHYDQLVPITLSIEKIEHSYAFPSFSFTYQGKNVKEIKSLWGEFYAKRIEPVSLGQKNQKPKVGFLVTQSHEGVFMKDAGGILKNLSSEKFDLVVLANGGEAMEGLKAFIDRKDITFLSFSKQLGRAVQEIAVLNLDFLYYWEIGSDALNYFLPYFQLARVQISSWGSAFTSGNPRVNYYWSSRWLENEDYLDHYTEQVVLFENLPTYYYRTGESIGSKTRADFDLPEDCRIYLCVQSMSKIHPDFDELLLGILERDDNALICFTTPKQQILIEQLLNRFRKTLGTYMNRIRVIKKIPHQEYLQLIKLADVCLDPPHYSGANTTYETLQMGVPVVTLPGKFQRGKYTEAIYRILNLEEYMAKDSKGYIDLAIQLATDKSKSKELIAGYNTSASRLFEQRGVIDEIEQFLLDTFKTIN